MGVKEPPQAAERSELVLDAHPTAPTLTLEAAPGRPPYQPLGQTSTRASANTQPKPRQPASHDDAAARPGRALSLTGQTRSL